MDTLEFSLYGGWDIGKFDPLKGQLNDAQKRARAGVDGAYIVGPEGDRLEVEPYGAKRGVGCKWVVQWNDCQISIVNNAMYSERRLSIFVSIGSLRLMEVGHEEAWSSLLQMLASLGYEHIREVASRVDPCVDLADRSMDEVVLAHGQDRLICRARSWAIRGKGKSAETYYRGSGPLLVRIYDKAVESQKDPIKQSVLIERRWGKRCKSAVRVEFQLRRKALKRHFSITTARELFDNLGTITKWCHDEWFRIVDEFDRKNRNHARAETSEFWKEVQQAFESWTGTALPRVRNRRRLVPDLIQLKAQAVGCVVSIAAHVDGQTFIDSWMTIGRELKEKAKQAVEQKRHELAAKARVIPDSQIPF